MRSRWTPKDLVAGVIFVLLAFLLLLDHNGSIHLHAKQVWGSIIIAVGIAVVVLAVDRWRGPGEQPERRGPPPLD